LPASDFEVQRTENALVSEFLTAFVSIALVNHLVLTHMLGLDAWFAGAYGLRRTGLFGLCVAFLMIFSTLLTYVLLALASQLSAKLPEQWLVLPLTMVFSSLLLVPLRLVLMHLVPADLSVLTRSFPVAALNSAVIGTSLLALWQLDSLAAVTAFAAVNALAFVMFLLIFSAIQQRVDTDDVPLPFRGTPVLLVSAGIMSLAILALEGIVP
jgi:electron transport complex protein RnfA